MDNLGDYLVLLSITSDKGTIATAQRIGYGLMGAELFGLAASGRIDIQRDRICVRDPSPTGDAELDTALASLVRARRAPRTQAWAGRPRRGIVQAYLNRLAAAGMVRAERRCGASTQAASHAATHAAMHAAAHNAHHGHAGGFGGHHGLRGG